MKIILNNMKCKEIYKTKIWIKILEYIKRIALNKTNNKNKYF